MLGLKATCAYSKANSKCFQHINLEIAQPGPLQASAKLLFNVICSCIYF